MPTYEYECRGCGHRFERVQSIHAAPRARCPRCSKAAKRLISSGAGLLFKGSGFYITDYRSSSYQAKAKAESGKKTPSKGDSGSKAGSKKAA